MRVLQPRKMPRLFLAFMLVLLISAFCACAATEKAPDLTGTVFGDVDFAGSAYKHVNNGGLGEGQLPYNIDAITGATLTVEGPGVVTSIPLSMRELENRNDGLFRGIYQDETGQFVYEGIDLGYLLQNMVDGANGIILTDKAYYVELKNSNRAAIARFKLEDIFKATQDGRPILLAYGLGSTDEAAIAPFVFDAANEDAHSEGYVAALDNADGCLKLVFDLQRYGENTGYTRFSNVAYVYVCEETEPGFKHTQALDAAYASSRYADYIVGFRGAALGRELDFTLSQLEDLVAYDKNGKPIPGGVGYSDFYSLANNAYWYVNEYEGLDLYKLLLYLGMEDAATMGLAASRTTLVSFVADDGVAAPENFSVDTLSYPEAFGFYQKNALDVGDGSYKPTSADLVQTSYPVLLAYGVNRYPYTVSKTDSGYLSGLSNNGGPLRVVFGKTQYNHANGSNQVQYLKNIIVGEDVLYNTHKYTDDMAQKALAENMLSITVTAEDGAMLLDTSMSVGEIEDLLYGENVAASAQKAAVVKDIYQADIADTSANAIYEGVNLGYFLLETLGLPGTNGTVTFINGSEELTVNLDALLRSGYNTELSREGLLPILAFAKNGAPLVPTAASPGYVAQIDLHPSLPHEPASYNVYNSGGPLAVLLPSNDPINCDARSLMNISFIKIDLKPDAYAHIQAPYSGYAQQEVRFYGPGLEREAVFTVAELEAKQTKAQTLDFSFAGGERYQQRYRGLALYDLFTEIGLKSNAGEVNIYSADGSTVTLSLSQLKRNNYINYLAPEKQTLFAILAFGSGVVAADTLEGLPLVPSADDAGYDAAYQNSGGPLRLILPQEHENHANGAVDYLTEIVAIEVSANEIDTWGHLMSDVYEEFLAYPFTLTVKNDDSEWSRMFTLEELESLTDIIVRDNYTVLDLGECEGLDIWKFVKKFAGDIPAIDDPIAVHVYASDGYKNDLLSVFYKEGLELGVEAENGERKPLLLAYALNGYPLVDSESHPGYTGLAGNTAGPLRVVAEGKQGASVKYVNMIVVTIPGSGPIENM